MPRKENVFISFLYQEAKSREDLENIMPSVTKQRQLQCQKWRDNGVLSSQLVSQNQELAKDFFFLFWRVLQC